jgi:AcrR family transcriptional regulator
MSPAATLDPSTARADSLHVADDLFYQRGVAAVTMADIRDESGVSLRRLYSMYASKSDLVAAWLRQRHIDWMTRFRERVSELLTAGSGATDAVFGAIEEWMTITNFRGCGFLNTLAEVSELTEEHREIIRTHKREVAEYLETITPDGQALAVLVDGAIVQAALFGNSDPIHVARDGARALSSQPAS